MAAPTRQRVARAVSWMGVGHVTSQGLWLASLLLLAALVPPKAFGTLATGMVLVNFAGLLVDSGTRGSIIAAPRVGPGELRGAVILNAVVGLAATAAIAGAAEPITGAFASGGDIAAIRVLSLGVFLYALGIAPLALLQKRLQFKRFAGANIAAATLSSAAGVAAGLAGAGVWALVVRQLASMALLTVFAWVMARDLVPRRSPGERASVERAFRLRQPGWASFFMFALTDFVALNADFLVVGNLRHAEGLGLYSLAFTLAFAPLTQVSWQVGRVLFPAAAATGELDTVARRTLVSLRLMGLLLAPFVAPIVVLAPTVLPGLLGDEWRPMVAPFQILLVVGVGHAMLGMIGESLAGTGNIAWRARVNVLWALGMIGALYGLVSADGIRGAAFAHLALFFPLAAAYVGWGARHLRLDWRRVLVATSGIALPIALQAATTAGVWAVLRAADASPGAAELAGALAGIAVVALALLRLPSSPLREGRAMFSAAFGGSTQPA